MCFYKNIEIDIIFRKQVMSDHDISKLKEQFPALRSPVIKEAFEEFGKPHFLKSEMKLYPKQYKKMDKNRKCGGMISTRSQGDLQR